MPLRWNSERLVYSWYAMIGGATNTLLLRLSTAGFYGKLSDLFWNVAFSWFAVDSFTFFFIFHNLIYKILNQQKQQVLHYFTVHYKCKIKINFKLWTYNFLFDKSRKINLNRHWIHPYEFYHHQRRFVPFCP